MFRRPRFQPHLRAEVVPGEGVFLLSEQHQTALQGRLYELVAPLLDGRTVEEVCAALRGKLSGAQVFYTLGQLAQKGWLSESDVSLPPPQAALWSLSGTDPIVAAQGLQDRAITIRAVGDVDPAPLRNLLEAMQVRLASDAERTVVATDGYLRDDLKAHNAAALKTGQPWLLVKPVGRQVWIGPLFTPGKTGCWACLAERILANSPLLAYLEEKRGRTGEAFADWACTPATLQVAWALTASAVTTWLATGALPQFEGTIRTLDVLSGEAQTHRLMRLPSCPACGEQPPADRPPAPVVLQSCPKKFTEDGGHRALTPQQTLERYGHHVSAITGAVSMLDRDGPPEDHLLHVYLAGHNVARRARSWAAVRRDLRSSNCGKGATDAQARASALGEGLERYSAVFRGDEPLRRARLIDLGDAGLHPNDCMHFSDKQYRDREAWNARHLRYDEVPLPFDPEAEIEWSPVWSLTRQTVRYLPTSFCYFNYPQDCRQAFCFSCSNGNAAGNTREEAILQGFLELVERDSVALWWYNRVRRPAVDLDSFNDPYLRELRAFLRRRKRDLWVLDLTADLEIPVFAAMSRRIDGAAEQVLFGFGAHIDAHVALLRGVTELNQMLGQVLYQPDDAPPGAHLTDKTTVEWLQKATVENQPYLAPLEGPARDAASFAAWGNDDIRDDVLACQALIERQGMELLVLDQTRAEIGLPVVKVIVPRLRHFWARFAPGRLYDVPVQLSWLRQPVPEEHLNPVPMFL
ncbi:MAG TPA: TOMM precursor leader peptide-binding protein [Gemmataceae bacterium]|jgi:ribosomal protein S12 methylthiotransferase accessory factor|nr:TOMM precursor leader peptide-binding protein [Gemmataceae bacterium]